MKINTEKLVGKRTIQLTLGNNEIIIKGNEYKYERKSLTG